MRFGFHLRPSQRSSESRVRSGERQELATKRVLPGQDDSYIERVQVWDSPTWWTCDKRLKGGFWDKMAVAKRGLRFQIRSHSGLAMRSSDALIREFQGFSLRFEFLSSLSSPIPASGALSPLSEASRHYWSSDIMFLSETKQQKRFLEKIKMKMKLENSFYVESIGLAGGLSLWWTKDTQIKILKYGKNFIDTEISSKGETNWF
ncbi:hypothetical protein V6N11_029025 [Hibiscus sabdariffa]|uniref:Uncharacterized protein n=2 Tax=Hibiscus sabdariffa TaxID=183260 RepID=A0ABR2BU42_9ROSI